MQNREVVGNQSRYLLTELKTSSEGGRQLHGLVQRHVTSGWYTGGILSRKLANEMQGYNNCLQTREQGMYFRGSKECSMHGIQRVKNLVRACISHIVEEEKSGVCETMLNVEEICSACLISDKVSAQSMFT